MLIKLLEKILNNKIWFLLMLGVFLFIGVSNLIKLPIDGIPDISNVQVAINTRTGGLDPEQVEKTITYYIETDMSGLPNIQDIRSLSKFGLSQVILIFKEGTNIYWARQIVAERLLSVREKLPSNINPELGPISTGLGEVFMYTLLPKKGSKLEKKTEKDRLIYLTTINTFIVIPYIKSTVPGIAEVDVSGGYRKEIQIQVNPNKLDQYGITFEDIITHIQSVGENQGGGYLEKNNKNLIIRTDALISISAIGNIPIKVGVFGNLIKIKDVAEIKEDGPLRIGSASYNGKEAVIGTTLMLLGANSRVVTENIKKTLEKLELPDDVELKTLYSRNQLVSQTIQTVLKNLIASAFLVMMILYLIMGNFFAALIVSIAIPFSMFGAVIGMNYFGVSAHLLSLGAVDFGLLVDASVVFIECIIHKLETYKNDNITLVEKKRIILEAIGEVKKPVIFGMSIVALVYVPLLTLEGIEGKMFRPMSITVMTALITSLMVAIFLIPFLCYVFLKRPKHSEKVPLLFGMIQKIYTPILMLVIQDKKKNKLILFLGLGCILLLCAVLFSRFGTDFVPTLDEGDMLITITHPSDASLTNSIEFQKKAEILIKAYPEVNHVYSKIGTPESSTDPMGFNLTDMYIILNEKKTWPKRFQERRFTKAELYSEFSKKLKKISNQVNLAQNQPVAMKFNEMLEGSRADISLRIYGKDLNKLFNLQNTAIKIIRDIRGVEEISVDPLTALRKAEVIKVQLDYEKLSYYNISVNKVNEIIHTALIGNRVGSYYEYDWRFPIRIKLGDQFSNSIDDIGKIPVPLLEPGSIQLSKVTNIKISEDVTVIARGKNSRYAGVAVNISDRDMVSFIEEAKNKMNSIHLEDGYRFEWGGQFKNLERAKSKLKVIIPAILLIIFILLYVNLNSLKNSIFVFLGIPFACTGGIIALAIAGLSLSVTVYVGFIILAGLAILNGTVLISVISQMERDGAKVIDAVINGTLERLRPVSMTAMVAMFGFIPMAMNNGVGAEIQKPLAIVVIGGLISSTVLTLVLLPTFYLWFPKK